MNFDLDTDTSSGFPIVLWTTHLDSEALAHFFAATSISLFRQIPYGPPPDLHIRFVIKCNMLFFQKQFFMFCRNRYVYIISP